VVCGGASSCNAGACTSPGATYSQGFTQNATANAQCGAWQTFEASLTGSYSSIQVSGSQDPTGFTCLGAAANQICQAIHTKAPVSVACAGRTWRVSTGCGTGEVELSLDGDVCACSSGYILRPCIGNLNWGGINGNTCGAVSQTMTVSCK